MIIPIRCFTCGKVIAHRWDTYVKMMSEQKYNQPTILDIIGFKRECCRRMFISHIDLCDNISSLIR